MEGSGRVVEVVRGRVGGGGNGCGRRVDVRRKKGRPMEKEGVLPGLHFLYNFGGALALLWCGVHRRLHAGNVHVVRENYNLYICMYSDFSTIR